jgi:hypothetical protein
MSEIVVTQYQLDISQFEEAIGKATKGMESLDKTTDKTEESTADLSGELGSASDKMVMLEKTSKVAGKGLDEVGEKSGGASEAFKTFKNELNSAFPIFGKIGNAAKALGVVFKSALGPIGIAIAVVVGAIGGLLAAFGRTQEGADQLRKVTALLEIGFDRLVGFLQVLGKALFDAFSNPKQAIIDIGNAIQQNITNRIQAVGEGFRALADVVTNTAAGIALSIKGIFDDDAKKEAEDYFAAAGEASIRFGKAVLKGVTGLDDVIGTVRDGFNAIGAEIDATTKAADRLRGAEIALRKARIAQAAEQGKLNRLFQEQVQISQDVNKTAEERTAAAQQAIAAQDRLATLSKAVAQQELNILEIKAAQNDTDDEALLLITQKRAELEQIDADRLSGSRRVQNVINGIEKQIADQAIAEQKRIAEEQSKLQEARQQGQAALDAFLAEKRKERELADATELERRVFLAQDAAAKEVAQARKLADDLRAISDEEGLPAIKAQEAETIKLIEEQLAADLAVIREGVDAEEFARLEEQLQKRSKLVEGITNDITDVIGRAAAEQENIATAASKGLLDIALKSLEAQAPIWSAQIVGGSLATPQSIASGGAAGIIQFTALLAILRGVIALARSAVAGAFYDGGIVGKDGGTKYKNGKDGYLVRAHEGEHIMPTNTTRKYLPYLEAMRNGTFERMISTTAALNSFEPSATTTTTSFNDKRLVGALGGVGSVSEQRKQTELLAAIARGMSAGRSKRYHA